MKKLLLTAISIFMVLFSLTVSAAVTNINIGNMKWDGATLNFPVSTDNALSGTLPCGVYDEKGCLVGIDIEKSDIPTSQWSVSVAPEAEKGSLKVMLWNSLGDMQPIAEIASSDWSKAEKENKILVAYFAYSENIGDTSGMELDAVASASLNAPTNNTSGNLQVMANEIKNRTNADIHSIVISKPYNPNYSDMVLVAKNEIDNNIKPELVTKIENIEQYDTIYIGTPVWYGVLPPAMNSFFAEYDLSGKTVISFGIHLGSRWGSMINEMKSAEPDAKFIDGLTVQRFLFGPQIGTITDGMEESLKMQTLFLSGICFGDFYNRVGLPLYEREFITLCTIVGNGNCRSQLNGHVNGNLGVGYSKDMLRAAMLHNADINGEEKTALIFEVINTVEAEANENPTPERPQPTQAIKTDFKSDSEEILSLMAHFKSDDKDNYVGKNIDSETQNILIQATEAVINGTQIPTSADKATQVLIDLAVMDAQGGRETEISTKIAEGYSAGLTADNMLAVPLLTAPYNGFPRTLNMRGAIAAEIENAQATPDVEKTVITMQIDNPKMTINGAEQAIDAEGTTPVVVNDRTLLPVRAFVEGIGGTVNWDEETQTATLTYNGDEIRLTINSTTAYLNNEAKTLDVTPVIINDRTMLPIRFIAESFGFAVDWTQETQTVTITQEETTSADIKEIANVFGESIVNPFGDNFTGASYLKALVEHEEIFNLPFFGLVTFEPCTRTDWHSHNGGQILLVTEGEGFLGLDGETSKLMRPGDVLYIKPGENHFHSAVDNSWFSHIALGVNPDNGGVVWGKKVTDEEFKTKLEEARKNASAITNKTTMFPAATELTESGYNGKVFTGTLVENESVFNSPEVKSFTFEANARTAWHSHEGGQVIVVTDGTGIYQEEGQAARIIKAGDVILANPGVKHWHGAADNGNFAYIAANANPGKDKITWAESVSDDEYKNALNAVK